MSLRLRLTLWYGFLLALSLVAFGSLLYVVLRGNLERQLDDALRLRAAQLSRSIAPGADGQLSADDIRPGQLGPASLADATGPDLYVQVLDTRGEVVAASGTQLPIDPEYVISALDGSEDLVSLPLGGGRFVRLLTMPLRYDGQTIGVVQVGDTLDSVDATLSQVRDTLAVGALVILVLAVAGGLLIAGRALAAVGRVSATARQIASTGDFGQRLAERRSRDEIGELVETFNELIRRVEFSLDEQRRFLADTSHELRSPLTVIRANLGFLWRDTDADTRAECLREAEAEADRMSRLVNDLLLLGQSGADEFLVRTPVALEQLLSEVLEQTRAQADGRQVELGRIEPVVVQADCDRLKQVLWNLVTNALRHTPASGTITLSLHNAGGLALLRVADTGSGIPPEHLPRIFERFYRVDSARTRSTGGAGLGLSIVRHIVAAHGGQVSVESTLGQGSIFTVQLPVEPVAATPELQVGGTPARLHSHPLLRGVSR